MTAAPTISTTPTRSSPRIRTGSGWRSRPWRCEGRCQGHLDESRPCLIATLRQRDVGLARSKDFGLAWPDGRVRIYSVRPRRAFRSGFRSGCRSRARSAFSIKRREFDLRFVPAGPAVPSLSLSTRHNHCGVIRARRQGILADSRPNRNNG